MAKIQSPIIGACVGQAGGMVFTRVSGKNIMRSKAFQVKDANSDSQKEQRFVFPHLVSIANSIALFSTANKPPRAQKFKVGSEIAQKIKAVLTYDDLNDFTLAPESITDGGNALISYKPTSIACVASDKATITWDKDQPMPTLPADARIKIYLVSPFDKSMVQVGTEAGYSISAETATVDLPGWFTQGKKMFPVLATVSNLSFSEASGKYFPNWPAVPSMVGAAGIETTVDHEVA